MCILFTGLCMLIEIVKINTGGLNKIAMIAYINKATTKVELNLKVYNLYD